MSTCESNTITGGSCSDNILSLTKQDGSTVDIPFEIDSETYYVTSSTEVGLRLSNYRSESDWEKYTSSYAVSVSRIIQSRNWSRVNLSSTSVRGDLYSISAGDFEIAYDLTPGPIIRNSVSRSYYTKDNSSNSSSISQCIAIDTSEFRGEGSDNVNIYNSSAEEVSFVPGDKIIWHNIQLGTGAYRYSNGSLFNVQISKNTNELVDIEETFEWEVKPYTYSYFRIIPHSDSTTVYVPVQNQIINDSGAQPYQANPALTGMFTDQTTYSIYRSN